MVVKKRKLTKSSTPSSKQPKPAPLPEPVPMKEEEESSEDEEEEESSEDEEEEASVEEEEEEESEEEEEEDQKPQTLAAPNPSADQVESDPESIKKILDFFSKDQLVDLLRNAAVKSPDLLKEIHRIADVDIAHRKVFVHGLGWDTTAQMLMDFFSQFGDIEDCKAVTDKITGKSKGYAFILFKHRKGAQNALKEPQKKIGNRMAACQLASAGPVTQPPPAPPVSEYTQRKIFVSNVGAELDPQKLLQFFAKFGEIEEGPLGLDKVTGKPRGFCLFVYKMAESVKKVLDEPHKNFEGHVLHCQRAVDGPKMNKAGFHGGQYSGGVHGQKGNFSGGAAAGHLMAPPATGYNQAPVQPVAAGAGLNPVLGQALTALLATQGVGGLANLLVGNQVVPGQMANSGYGGYGGQVPGQGGYGSGPQTGQGGGVRGQQGYGNAGGGQPYMGQG